MTGGGPPDGGGRREPGSARVSARLDAVARGERPADIVVAGGRVLRPDGRLRERSVAVVGDRIAALVEDPGGPTGPATTTVDAAGATVIPGLIDAHDHVDVHSTVERRYHRRLARGTTAVVTESSSMATAGGAEGVAELLAATADLPLSVFATVPPQVLVDTFEPASADESEREALAALLERERVVGVGETDWIHVVGRDAGDLRWLYDRAREAGVRVVGHGAGCRGEKLSAFATAVDDDHEAVAVEGVEGRLARGLHVVGRRGSIRDDLDAVAGADRPRGSVSLCTDGTWPGDDCGMDDVVRAAIDRGIDPVEAVEMATRNPAAHFDLEDRGEIAPGARADLVVCPDLQSVAVETVLAGGEVVVEDGDPLVGPSPHGYPDRIRESVHLGTGPNTASTREGDANPGTDSTRDVDADLAIGLRIPATAGRDGTVRTIRSDEGLVTREGRADPPVEDGAMVADPDGGLLKAALFDRRPDRSGGFVGFVEGLGLDRGAVATTLTWEQPGLLAVGGDDGAMATAIERLAAIGGGWVVVDRPGADGRPSVTASLPMPVAATMADRPPAAVAEGYAEVRSALSALGGRPDPGPPRANGGDPGPVLALQTLAFPGVPVLKLSLSGYAHVLERATVGLDPDEGP